jgi:predicted PurR-regulated permease PerM
LIDNFVRPFLARYGHLEMSAFLVLVSMLGGAAAFGALALSWGRS